MEEEERSVRQKMTEFFVALSKYVEDLRESSSSSSDEDELEQLYIIQSKSKPTPTVSVSVPVPVPVHSNIIQFKSTSSFIPDVVDLYTDSEFKYNFRITRGSVKYLIDTYCRSEYFTSKNLKARNLHFGPKEQILLFLWFCSHKITIFEVSSLFNTTYSSVHKIFNNVLMFLVEQIAPQVIQFPQTVSEKEEIAKTFEDICGFPNVLGCLDGTYISVRTPKRMRFIYTNKNNCTSITMHGICDADLRFLDVFAGLPRKVHESRVLKLSFIDKELPALCFPNYHLLGDSSYPIREQLMTAYQDNCHLSESEKIYNVKFSQTYVKIQDAFNMLKSRFKQLTQLDFQQEEKMANFVIACCAIHNICIDRNDLVEIEDVESDFIRSQKFDESAPSVIELGERKRNEIRDSICKNEVDLVSDDTCLYDLIHKWSDTNIKNEES